MNKRLLLCVVSLLNVIPFHFQPVLLPNYKISLYSDSLRLSTVLWLRPAYCLFEEWQSDAVDLSVAIRKTSSIIVQVQIQGDNSTYIVQGGYVIPQCRPIFNELQATEPFVYQVGPNIELTDGKGVQLVLPNHSYKVRYVLYNAANTQIAFTNWSQPFQTRDIPTAPQDMNARLQGRSGGMVVITVLLSISMFCLLVGLAVVLGVKQP
ncbi:uroplakin-2-like [Xenopus laevis]|uniref:Uroplakin-2-like n=1 Tax=Xenopus laevis TaxID=8355 RepID=A0A8J0TBU3_XENLA|nr:uroplakin-2-like [Xenopus laevis]